jgi:hypothetical protein
LCEPCGRRCAAREVWTDTDADRAVTDDSANDTGTLNAWSLRIEY